MAHHKAALKSIKQDAERTRRNRHFKTTMRSAIKKLHQQLDDSKTAEAREQLPVAYSIIDHCASRGVIHKNAADRYKARLTAAIAKQK